MATRLLRPFPNLAHAASTNALALGRHQTADVDLPVGDNSGERRHHVLEAGELLQSIHLRLLRLQVGGRGNAAEF
jgi:hypothetical protein